MESDRLKIEEMEKQITQLKGQLIKSELNKKLLEERLKRVKMQELQYQINPHFLFNTLNVISMLALIGDTTKVYELIMDLSKFMRYSLKKCNRPVLLKDEIDMVGKYLLILKARMGKSLEYEINCRCKKSEFRLPLFTLQPLVENAYEHGVAHGIGVGKIIVHVKEESQNILLRIYNNGIEMSKGKLQEVRYKIENSYIALEEEEHIGIANVCSRLYMLYGENVKVSILSRKNKGTLVMIKIKK